jgi:hypothetical protein
MDDVTHDTDSEWEFNDSFETIPYFDLVFDDDIFVMDKKEIGKDIGQLLTFNSLDTSNVGKNAQALVDIFMVNELPHVKFIAEKNQVNEYLSKLPSSIKPVVHFKKNVYTDISALNGKTQKMSYIYSEDSKQEKTKHFLQQLFQFHKDITHNAASRDLILQRLYSPFDQSDKTHQHTMHFSECVDAIFLWENDAGEKINEEARILENDRCFLSGLCFDFASNTRNTKPVIFNLSEYEDFINNLKIGDTVYLFPSRTMLSPSIVDMKRKEGKIIGKNEYSMTIEVSGDQIILQTANIVNMLDCSFSLGSKTTTYYKKSDLFKSKSIVIYKKNGVYSFPRKLLEVLLPTAAEVFSLNPNSKNVFNLNDMRLLPVKLVTDQDAKDFKSLLETNITSLAHPKNIQKEKSTFINSFKSSAKFLQFNFPFANTYQNTEFGRTHFLHHYNLITQQIFECINIDKPNNSRINNIPTTLYIFEDEKLDLTSHGAVVKHVNDVDKIKPQTLQKKSCVVFNPGSTNTYVYVPDINNDMIWSFSEVFSQDLNKTLKQIKSFTKIELTFTSLSNAYKKLPTSENEKAIVFTFSNEFFILVAKKFGHKMYWIISLSETKTVISQFNLELNKITKTIYSPIQTENFWKHELNECFVNIKDHKNPRDNSDIYNKFQNPNTAQYIPNEQQYIKLQYEIHFEGDEDMVDFEALLNNKEYGMNYLAVEDEEDEDEDEEKEETEMHLDKYKQSIYPIIKKVLDDLLHVINISINKKELEYVVHIAYSEVNVIQLNTQVKNAEDKAKKYLVEHKLNSEQSKVILSKLDNIRIEHVKKSLMNSMLKIIALLALIVQTKLPNVIINPIDNDECKKAFGYEGYPLNDNKEKSLCNYLAQVFRIVIAKSFLISISDKMTVDVISEQLKKHISTFYESSHMWRNKIDNARANYAKNKSEYTKKHENILKTYSVWNSFKPFISSTKDLDIPENYMVGRLFKAVSNTKNINNQQHVSNSCCMQRLGHGLKSFWETYAIPYQKPSSHQQRQILNIISIRQKEAEPVVASKKIQKIISNNLLIKPIKDNFDGMPMSLELRIKSFISANIFFEHDSYLEEISDWSNLSNVVVLMLNQIEKCTGLSLVDKLKIYVTNVNDNMPIFIQSFYNFIHVDLSKLLGRIGEKLTLSDLNYISKKSSVSSSDKEKINEIVTQGLEFKKDNMFIDDTTRDICKHLVINGMQNIGAIAPHVCNEECMYHYMYTYMYIFAKYILIILKMVSEPEVLLEKNYKGFNNMIGETVLHSTAVKTFINDILELFFKRMNLSYDMYLKNITEYEKQRENLKQSIIEMLSSMDPETKLIVKQLKKVGLTTYEEMMQKKDQDIVEKVNDIIETDVLENVDVDQDEGEAEIAKEIMNFKGENDDDGDDE